jgi:hypothetical protein
MNELSKEKVNKIIKWAVLCVLGIFCYLYSVFGSDFAEINAQFPFLNFPIFVGEFLLAFCITMLLIKWKTLPIKINRWHFILFVYIAFVLTKAFYGYYKWGPLAFRNSALFYYPLFAVIGFYFFDLSFFRSDKIKIFLFIALILTVTTRYLPGYTIFNYFILAIILAKTINIKVIKFIFVSLALLFFPYKQIFCNARSVLVASIAGISSIVFLSLFLFKNKLRYKMLILGLFVALVGSGIYFFSDTLVIASLVRLDKIRKEYKKYNDLVIQREKFFKTTQYTVKLYSKNKNSIFNKVIDNKPKSERIVIHKTDSNKQMNIGPEIFTDKKLGGSAILQERINVASEGNVNTPKEVKLSKQPAALDASENSPHETIGPVEVVPQERINVASEGNVNTPKEVKLSKQPVALDASENKINEKPINLPNENIDSINKNTKQNKFYKIGIINSFKEKNYSSSQIKDLFGGRLNILFRIFMWKDSLTELFIKKPILGFDFGKPMRSKSIEILDWARDWKLDGWISLHNSYLEIIYRAGIVGILMILLLFYIVFTIAKFAISYKSLTGAFLFSIIIYWLVIPNFLVIFELPYSAILFWSLLGMTLRYFHIKETDSKKYNL